MRAIRPPRATASLLAGTACLALAATLATLAPALAQDTAELEEVVVVGTRTAGRTVLESPVPVDVVGANELARAATIPGELGSALQALVPSFNFPRQSNSGTADNVRAAQLRGLSPDQVLVLVNGKRRHTSSVVNLESKIGRGTSPVDFNTIPTNAIQRVEVLRDGAGAQYGSDAVAGVINVVLKGGGSGGQVSSAFGLHHTDFEPTGQTLTDGQTWTANGDVGLPLGQGGFVRVGAEYLNRNATNRAGIGVLPFFEEDTPANNAAVTRRVFKAGDGDVEATSVFYNGELPAGDATLYSFGTYADRDSTGSGFFRFPDSSANIPSIFPFGYVPETTGKDKDLSLTAGARADLAGWDLDTSVTYGRNRFRSGLSRSLNPSLGAASPTSFRLATYTFDQLTANLDLSREYDVGLAGPLTVAAGAEYRRETFETKAGDPASYAAGTEPGKSIGAQAGPGLAPADTADLDRDVYALYLDLEGKLTDRLDVTLAGRYEHYSDFGDSVTGKAAARFEVADGWALRGSVSNSFRAPSLSQSGFQFTTVNLGDGGALTSIRQLAVDNPIARALGAEDLEEETSFNLAGGIVGRVGAFTLSVDVFQIDVDDRITLSERIGGTALTDFIQSRFGVAGIENVTFFTNAVDTRTRGIDVVAGYGFDLTGPLEGRLDLTAAYNRADTDIRRVRATPAALLALGVDEVVFGVEERNTLEGAAPKDKLILSADWQGDRFGALARATRFGKTTRVFNFGGGFTPTQTYGAEWAIDLELSAELVEGLTLAVGGNNVFDNYPDRSIEDIGYFGHFPYDVLSPVGLNGAYYYVRTRYTF